MVRDEGAGHLRAYFAPGAYTGSGFETFAGGGDRAESCDSDLYAVEALNVQVPFAVPPAPPAAAAARRPTPCPPAAQSAPACANTSKRAASNCSPAAPSSR
ncbi:DUF6308 family protein [Dactylosporangium sp. NPDC005572]|uniref:DUF6308 family protein n=1 Tax=Dactylosporangium sp. NPDC005572 TaxID=3156889 RepID=UPI0033B24E10